MANSNPQNEINAMMLLNNSNDDPGYFSGDEDDENLGPN